MSDLDSRAPGDPPRPDGRRAGGAAGPCPRCGDLQYLTAGDGDRATARACDCAAVCTRCGGAGHLTETDAGGYLFVRPCRCSYLHERVALFNAAGLPARYHKKTIEGYQHAGGNQNEVRYALLSYRRTYRAGQRGVLLMGAPGTGKTHLLVALLGYLSLERGYRCRYVDFMTLLSELKDGYNSNRSEAAIIGPLVRVPILAVDELGKGRNSEWEQGVLDELISQRYNARRTTLFATNYRDDPPPLGETRPRPGGWRGPERADSLTAVTLEERIGPRIYSRLRDMCDFMRVEGPDYRQRKR
jgi:DNA replication protein DnaC